MRKYKPVSPTMKRRFERAGCTFGPHPDEKEHRAMSGPNGVGLGICGFGPDGGYIGIESDNQYFRWLARIGIYAPLKSDPSHNTASIGIISKGENIGKWAGWSHRAVMIFGKGDLMFEAKYIKSDETLFRDAGKVIIKTEEQAKQAAINFSKYIS